MTLHLLDAYNALFERQFFEIISQREESFVMNGHQLWKNNLRLHNIQLKDFL